VADHGLDDELLAFIEIPKGSRNKYEFDEGIGQVILDRFLSSSTVYPTDYGYLIGHRGQDGDPLDCLVIVSEPTFPGCVIPVKPVALFKMTDEKGIDDKIICVPLHDPGWNQLEELDDLPQNLRKEVPHFFSVYKELDEKPVEIDGWYSREEALQVIAEAKKLQEEQDAEREQQAAQGGDTAP
jgi:inorganic pyrophosphatase